MASTKVMSIIVKLEDSQNLRLDIPQTRANLALVKSLGEFRTLKVPNPWGRNGKPKVKVSKPRAKRTTKKDTVTA